MIDLTPLDVRKKHQDFKRNLRGFDTQEVQVFLEMVAERLEELVRENIQLRERCEALQDQVSSQTGREKAVQDALVTAQELRSDIHDQAQRTAELVVAEAETEARRRLAEAEAEVRSLLRDAQRKLEQGNDAIEELERRRGRFLLALRQLLERELDVVASEEGRQFMEGMAIELDLVGGRAAESASAVDGVSDVAGQVASLFGASGEEGEGEAPGVDESAAQEPPMDAPVDELAASYEKAGAESETLSLSLEEAVAETEPDEEGAKS